jgi:invasion protein IalB
MYSHRLSTICAASLGIAALFGTVSKAEPIKKTIGDWQLSCDDNANGQRDCKIEQYNVLPQDESKFVMVLIRPYRKDMTGFVFTVPATPRTRNAPLLPVLINGNIGLMPFIDCKDDKCAFGAGLQGPMSDIIINAKTIGVDFNVNGQAMEVSVAGLKDALAEMSRLKAAPALPRL